VYSGRRGILRKIGYARCIYLLQFRPCHGSRDRPSYTYVLRLEKYVSHRPENFHCIIRVCTRGNDGLRRSGSSNSIIFILLLLHFSMLMYLSNNGYDASQKALFVRKMGGWSVKKSLFLMVVLLKIIVGFLVNSRASYDFLIE